MIDPRLLTTRSAPLDSDMFVFTDSSTTTFSEPSTPSSVRLTTTNLFANGPQTPVSPRIRPSAENAIHGRVEGAKRGNMSFRMFSSPVLQYNRSHAEYTEIIRPRGLPPTIKDSRVAGARFYRLIIDLIARVSFLFLSSFILISQLL